MESACWDGGRSGDAVRLPRRQGHGLRPGRARLAAGRSDRHCCHSTTRAETRMTQTSNRIFDEFARLMNDAAGVASGVRREFDALFRTQADRVLRDLDLVRRDE